MNRHIALVCAALLAVFAFGIAAPASAAAGPGSGALALLAVQQAQLTAADGTAEDHFGTSVAIAGDTAVVGAPWDAVGVNSAQGSAYVFTRNGSTWSQQQRLTAADGATYDSFGNSVAIAGDTVVVGAWGDVIGANSAQGSAYVFTRSGSTWSQQQKLTAADGAAGDLFGSSVAIAGDSVVVGAWYDVVGANSDQGSAYVFTRSGSTWSQQQKLTAADGAADDTFGNSVAISGDTVVVGAWRDVVGSYSDQGLAYVFTRSGSTWSQQQKLTAGATGAGGGNYLCNTVAIAGDTVVVGATEDGVGANEYQGSAYVFARTGGTWSQQQQLTAADGAAGDLFGSSVAIAGDTVVVGAWYDVIGASFSQGSAYVFTRSGSTWSQQQKLTAADGAAGDHFGNSVAISGDIAVVGGYLNDLGANMDQGSAYVFSGLPASPVDITVTAGPNGSIAPGTGTVEYGSDATFTITPDAGYCIDSLTVDGEAVTPQGSWTFTNVTAPHRMAATFAATPSAGAVSFAAPVDYASSSVLEAATVGDFNGDGKIDLAMTHRSSPRFSLSLGNGDGTFAAQSEFALGGMGVGLAAGDLNGDGKQDLLSANCNSNSVSVVLGNGDGTFAAKTDFGTGAVPASVVAADFNGDGKQDLAAVNQGSATVSVLLGDGSGGFAAKTDFGVGTFANPISIASADFNGDGKQDLVTANNGAGTVSVLLGNGTGGFAAKTDYAVGRYPNNVVLADFNGDGDKDLATSNFGDGTVSVLLGNGTGGFAAKTDFGTGSGTNFVAAGDFNGDGDQDLATANRTASTVSVLLGNGGGGFAAKADFALGSAPYSVSAGDFNGDTMPDLAILNFSASAYTILLNTTPRPDRTPPTTTDDASAEWVNGPLTIAFTADDGAGGSGMSGGSAKTEYSLDAGASWQSGTSVSIDPDWDSSSTDGLEVLYRSTDAAGNREEAKSCIARIDTQKPWSDADPVTAVAGGPTIFSFTLGDTDPGSPTTGDLQGVRVWVYKDDAVDRGRGKGRVRYRPLKMFNVDTPYAMNEAATLTVPHLGLPAGRYYYKVYVTDWAGNNECYAGGNWVTVTP